MARPRDQQLFDFLSAYDRAVAELALALREMLLEEAPEAQEKLSGTIRPLSGSALVRR